MDVFGSMRARVDVCVRRVTVQPADGANALPVASLSSSNPSQYIAVHLPTLRRQVLTAHTPSWLPY